MKNTLLSLLAVAVLLGATNVCRAQNEMKPVVIGSLAGYDKLLGDIGTIGQLAGNPNLGKGLEFLLQMFTQGKGLAGLDKSQPLGFVLLTDGQQFIPYVFIPVTDLKQLVEVAKSSPQLAENITLDDGVYKIGSGIQTIYLQQTGKWAVMTAKREDLARAPPIRPNCSATCRGNTIWRSACPSRTSAKFREQVLACLQAGAQVGMSEMSDEWRRSSGTTSAPSAFNSCFNRRSRWSTSRRTWCLA